MIEIDDRDMRREMETEIAERGRGRWREMAQYGRTESWSQACLGLNSAHFSPLEVEVLKKCPSL